MQLWDTYPLWLCICAVQVCKLKYTKRALLNSNFINKIQCNSYSGVNNNTTLFVFVFVLVQSVSNGYCAIWSGCAANHLTLRDSEWRVNLGPACRCHTWTSPCLPSTWEPLFVFAFCFYFQLTIWKADHGRKFDYDDKHGNNVWMPCKGELFDQSEAWSTVRKRPLKTLWIVMVISSWGRWWKKIDIYEDDYLWRLLLFRKGLIKMDRNRNAGLSENDSPLSNHPISSSSCNSSARLEMLAGLDFYQHWPWCFIRSGLGLPLCSFPE